MMNIFIPYFGVFCQTGLDGRVVGGCEDMDVDGRIFPSTSTSSLKIFDIKLYVT
jgi:hypothetical protein